MATTTSQIRSVVGDLYDRLAARPGLLGVTMFRYVPSPRHLEGVTEYIALAVRITGEQEFPAATNRLKYDRFTLETEIQTFAPDAGDDAADTAHERAEALLAEIEDEVRADPSLGRANTEVQVGGYEHIYGGDDRGRRHLLKVSLDCRTRNVST